MSDYAPVYGRPKSMTFTAGTTITGGQCLYISAADTVSPAGTNVANYIGIAAHDCASGGLVTVLMGAGVVHETPAVGATTQGTLLYAGSATAGELGNAAGTGYAVAIGVAIRTTSTAHYSVRWKSLVG